VSDNQIDQLRDALRREARDIQPVGLGVETVQRRGRHRRNRGRSVVAVGAVTCVAGLGVSVVHRQGKSSHSVAVAANAGAGTPPPALAFRTVDGTVSFATTHLTTAGGATYALSTAPASAGPPDSEAARDQTIYRTTDGEHWSSANQNSQWITDLSERDGVLYAVGTAPGAASVADIKYQVGTSNNDGKAWSDTELPFDLSPPKANVPISRSSSVQIAAGPSQTVALLTENFYPDLTSLIAARTGGKHDVATEATADGYVMRDYSSCANAKRAVVAKTSGAAVALEGDCKSPPALGTISWSDVGLSGPADLLHQEVLVSTDGSHWNSAAGPTTGYVRDLVADSAGFLLLADNDRSPLGGQPAKIETTLLRSSDATHWTPVALPAGLNVQAIAADRIVGTDESGALQTSTDGGVTWNSANVAAELPAGSPAATVPYADAGPLGFAAIATADANPNDNTRGHDYLLFSADGISWSTTDLAAAGAPAGASLTQVTVGSDHVGVDYQSANANTGGAGKITTLLATPKR